MALYPFLSNDFEDIEDPAIAKARRHIADRLGGELQNSVFVKLVLDNAEQDAMTALLALASIDPADTSGIQALQNKIARARDIASWMIGLLEQGTSATEELSLPDETEGDDT